MATVIKTHTHAVIDDDRPFRIDPNSKEILFDGAPLQLAQRSKNSERLTFTIPATTIEGHDMKACNAVMIHFQNIGQDPGQVSKGVYQVDDLKVENDNVTLTWLVGDEATVYAGGLIFSIHFICTDADGSVVYDFPTLTYSKITVGPTVWNSETIEREYPDIIAQFAADIAALKTSSSIVAYNFTAVEEDLPEADVNSLNYIWKNWGALPMSIYVQGYPVINVIAPSFDLIVLYEGKFIATFHLSRDEQTQTESLHLLSKTALPDSNVIFTEKALIWDGNTEGRIVHGEFVHVSDAVPSLTDLANGATVETFSGIVDTFEQFGTYEDVLSPFNFSSVWPRTPFLVATIDGAQLGVGEPLKKGVYFFFEKDSAYSVRSLTIPGYDGFAAQKIAVQALPAPEECGAVSFNWQNLTEEQKAQARANIGAVGAEEIGDIETALDAIIAVQESLIGGEAV